MAIIILWLPQFFSVSMRNDSTANLFLYISFSSVLFARMKQTIIFLSALFGYKSWIIALYGLKMLAFYRPEEESESRTSKTIQSKFDILKVIFFLLPPLLMMSWVNELTNFVSNAEKIYYVFALSVTLFVSMNTAFGQFACCAMTFLDKSVPTGSALICAEDAFVNAT